MLLVPVLAAVTCPVTTRFSPRPTLLSESMLFIRYAICGSSTSFPSSGLYSSRMSPFEFSTLIMPTGSLSIPPFANTPNAVAMSIGLVSAVPSASEEPYSLSGSKKCSPMRFASSIIGPCSPAK